eukprot:scaffold18039_cov166-Amphora_coffeaeformis.AAC.2
MPKKKRGKTKPSESTEDLIYVDPSRVRFQHSRIRPQFSGCGRSVTQTLDDLRQALFTALYYELSPLTFARCEKVIVGPDSEQGPWYFSLNNRRLWVFKRLREEGLLPNNQIAVRVRPPKSDSEKNRYSLENCALEAKLMREGPPSRAAGLANDEVLSKDEILSRPKGPTSKFDREAGAAAIALGSIGLESDGDDDVSSEDDDSSVEGPVRSNPFSVLG